MSGDRETAQLALGRPLDGGVRRHLPTRAANCLQRGAPQGCERNSVSREFDVCVRSIDGALNETNDFLDVRFCLSFSSLKELGVQFLEKKGNLALIECRVAPWVHESQALRVIEPRPARRGQPRKTLAWIEDFLLRLARLRDQAASIPMCVFRVA